MFCIRIDYSRLLCFRYFLSVYARDILVSRHSMFLLTFKFFLKLHLLITLMESNHSNMNSLLFREIVDLYHSSWKTYLFYYETKVLMTRRLHLFNRFGSTCFLCSTMILLIHSCTIELNYYLLGFPKSLPNPLCVLIRHLWNNFVVCLKILHMRFYPVMIHTNCYYITTLLRNLY